MRLGSTCDVALLPILLPTALYLNWYKPTMQRPRAQRVPDHRVAGNLRYRTWYLGLVRSRYGAASLSIYLSIRPRMSSALSAPASKSVRIRISVRERQRENLAGRLACAASHTITLYGLDARWGRCVRHDLRRLGNHRLPCSLLLF